MKRRLALVLLMTLMLLPSWARGPRGMRPATAPRIPVNTLPSAPAPPPPFPFFPGPLVITGRTWAPIPWPMPAPQSAPAQPKQLPAEPSQPPAPMQPKVPPASAPRNPLINNLPTRINNLPVQPAAPRSPNVAPPAAAPAAPADQAVAASADAIAKSKAKLAAAEQQIRAQWRKRTARPFYGNWWKNHTTSIGWYPWYQTGYAPGYWYRSTTVPTMTGWFRFVTPEPIYYSYGGGEVYYWNGVVYIRGRRRTTARGFYDQASLLARRSPGWSEAQRKSKEWLPLGVYALAGDDGESSNMVVQLAATKEGVLAGTYHNIDTNATRPLEGHVDLRTQRATWRFADGKNSDFVFDTMAFNLTKSASDMFVHFGPDRTEVMRMVRLDAE